jgi:hypothetical protein
MIIERVKQTRLNKEYARIYFIGHNLKKTHVDLELDELKELQEQINQYVGFNEI